MKKNYVTILCTLFLGLSTQAQSINFELIFYPVTPVNGYAMAFAEVSDCSIAFADIDGDGDQDALVTGRSSLTYVSRLYTNDGLGKFTLVNGTPFKGVAYSSIAFTDIDGDGDQDVLITGRNNNPISELYTNDGDGNFTLVSGTPFTGVERGSIAFADIDGDGDQDVLITGTTDSGFISELYTNDGDGNFTLVNGTPFTGVGSSSIAFADVNGDGYQDVLITGRNSSNIPLSQLYTNDGNGNFALVNGTPFVGIRYSSIAFADIDGDGDQDVLITGQEINNYQVSILYTNDGNGNFTMVSNTPFKDVMNSSIAFADVDNDGDQDVFITGSATSNAIPFCGLYTNNGNGNFTLNSAIFHAISNGSIAFADIDGDGDQDILFAGIYNNGNSRTSRLYKNHLCTNQPKANLGADTAICLGETLTLDVQNAGATFLWSDGSTNQTINVTNAGTYFVDMIDNIGCKSKDTVIVTVNNLPTVTANGSETTVCDGKSVILTGGGAITYTWDNNITDGDAFNPTATATYTVIGEDANGCENTAQITVNVNPLPTVTATADKTTICNGEMVILTSGGNADTYTWDNSIIEGLAFIPSDTTIYTVTGTDVNGCENTAQVIINVSLPTVDLGTNTSLCVGETITLNAQNTGATYLWSDGSTNQTLSIAVAGTYSVIVEDAGGCIGKDTIEITVNNLPTVTANSSKTTICKGDAVTLTGNGAVTYTWNSGVTNGNAFNPTATTSYIVTGTDANGCKNKDTIKITVNSLPTVTASSSKMTICKGESVILTGSGAVTYTWNNGVTDGNAFIPTATATYTVTGTDANGCTNKKTITVTVKIDCDTAKTFELVNTLFALYPNPTASILTIENNANVIIQQVTLLNTLGQVVYVAKPSVQSTELYVSEFANGFYTVQIQTEQGVIVKKVEVIK